MDARAGRVRSKGGTGGSKAPKQAMHIDWRGPIGRGSGLGSASREYAQALRRQGWRVEARAGMGVHDGGRKSKGRRMLVYHYPPHTMNPAAARGRYDKVVLNTVWETTRIPARWRSSINRYDAVIVPSRHNLKAMRDSGVKVPLHLAPHGVDTTAFRPSNPPFQIPGSKGRFVFLSVFGFQHRKNPEALLRAYWEEFTDKDNVLLVIKTSGYGARESGAWIREKIRRYRRSLRIAHPTAPLVLLTRRMSSRELRGLYTAASAFVLPTRGEGVGMPFMEALASGVPVIATAWGGQMDFLKPSNSFLVPYSLKSPAASMGKPSAISHTFRSLFAEKGQLWAEADASKLKVQMRKASSNPALCREKGAKGRRDMMGMSWRKAGEALAKALEAVRSGKKGQPAGAFPGKRLPVRASGTKPGPSRRTPKRALSARMAGGSATSSRQAPGWAVPSRREMLVPQGVWRARKP